VVQAQPRKFVLGAARPEVRVGVAGPAHLSVVQCVCGGGRRGAAERRATAVEERRTDQRRELRDVKVRGAVEVEVVRERAADHLDRKRALHERRLHHRVLRVE
jgi:hypothetical protein